MFLSSGAQDCLIKNRKLEIDNIYDIFALRIITQSEDDCYRSLGVVHRLWSPLQSRFKDYISAPKSNLYQSLHTTVVSSEDKIVEVQIRSKEMNDVAEKGFASHFSYKSLPDGKRKVHWLEEIVEAQKDITDSEEFLEFLKIDLKAQDLIVSTPKGDNITLPFGATVLDFAYTVHTTLGDQCIGARINNQYVPLHRVLNYGETIRVLRNHNQHPSSEWLQFAKTAKAKSCIRRSIRASKNERWNQLGKAIFTRTLKNLDLLGDKRPDDEYFTKKFPVADIEELTHQLGSGELPIDFFRDQIAEDFGHRSMNQEALFINSENINLAHFSECCAPLPGDPLFGIFIPGKGIHIHHVDCPVVNSEREKNPDEVIPVWWTPDDNSYFEIGIEILALDRDFLLRDITNTFQTFGISVIRASIDTLGENVRNHFQIKVHGLAQLNALIRRLKEIAGVENVIRL